MKKSLLIFIMLFGILISLCSCKNSSVYDVKIDGVSYEVNADEKTIYDGTYTYQYSFSGNSLYYSIRISCPNGFEYLYTKTNESGTDSWNGTFNYIYTKPEVLCEVILADAPKTVDSKLIFTKIMVFLVLVGMGLIEILFPGFTWKIKYGWRYKNAEPSDGYLIINRIIAIIAIIAGILILFW